MSGNTATFANSGVGWRSAHLPSRPRHQQGGGGSDSAVIISQMGGGKGKKPLFI